jgi:hypothetical protein
LGVSDPNLFVLIHSSIYKGRLVNTKLNLDDSAIYQIQVQGVLGLQWADYLGGLAISVDQGLQPPVTTLSGQVMDQASLVGIINGLYDLGFALLSVEYQSSI